jgi:hypothetical protein
MKGAGSGEVGLAKQFLTRYPWHRLEPMPDTVAWADDRPTQNDIRPCAAGIGTELRVVYVPQARAIIATQLAAQTHYAVHLFDPVLGGQVSLGQVTTDEAGSWHCMPTNQIHDWVIVLEKRGK